MRRSFRSLLVGLLAVAQPLEATAQVYDFSPSNRYFRYRVEGIDVTGVNVVVRGPTEVVVTGTLTSAETRVRGGEAPYAYAVDSGSLPDGMTLDPATGAAVGTAARAGRYVFTVRVTDRTGQTGVSLPYAIVVQNRKLEITRSPSLSARSGTAYSDRLEASGGRQPYAWTVAQGVLPAGIGLNETTGALTGTATLNGQYLFRIQVKDADGAVVVSPEYVLFVDDSVLSIAGSAPAKGQVGSPFTARYAASGGHSPYSYALSGSPLPPGVALEADTGWIRGAPTAAGEYVGLRVRATDNTQRYVDSPYFSVSVVAPLTAAWTGGKAGTGIPYSAPVSPAGGRAPYKFALTAGTLPPGLALNTTNGFISGTPTREGLQFGLVVRVSDADGRVFDTDPFTLEVTDELVAVGTPPRAATRGMPYSYQVSAGGGLRPYGYRMSAGTLPAGLTLDGASGAISGAPTATGLAEGLRIRVTDAGGRAVDTRAFSIDVQEPVSISLAGLPSFATSGDDYLGRLTASGGSAPYTFSITGTLPENLVLNTLTGVVSGKTGSVSDFTNLVASVVDADGRQAGSPKFGIAISNPIAVDPPVPYATVGQTYTAQIPVRGGRAPFRFALATSLPDGLSLDAGTGVVSGTPARIGVTSKVVLQVVDVDGRSVSTSPFDFTVDPTTAVVSAPTRSLMVAMKDSVLPAPAIKDGTAPFTYALNKDAPSWLTIDPATGVIRGSGQGSVGSLYGLQIETTDARGRVGRSPGFSMRLVAPMTISYGRTLLPFDRDNRAAFPVAMSDGCGNPQWSMSSNRPLGVDVDTIGKIYTNGLSRLDEGNWPGVVVTAVDACGVPATVELSIDVQPGSAYVQAPEQIVVKAGASFATDPARAVNMAPATFSLGSQTPPNYFAFDAKTGVLSGQVPADTPNGTIWNYTIQALDGYGRRGFAGNSTSIKAVTPPRISYANGGRLPFQTDGYGTYASTVVGGCTVSNYAVTAGTLPGGLSLRAATGAIEMSGAPMYPGRSNPVTITLRDTCDQVASTDVVFDLQTGSPSVTGPSQKALVIGAATSTDAAKAIGLSADAAFAVTGGSLPAGVAFDAGRRFTGTLDPSVAPGTTFGPYVIRVSDDFGRAAQSETISLTAVAAAQISYAAQSPATTGQTFLLNPTVTGGAAPFAYQLAGTLPAGLSFSPGTGRIDGTPTGTGTSANLTVRITDATGYAATSNAFSIQTTSAVSVAGTPPDAQTGTAYSYAFTATGGQGGLTFSTGATLPAGLSLSGAGVLSGTPTQNGAFSLAIVATDAYGRTGTRFVSMTIGKAASGGAWSSWGTGQLGNGETSTVSYVPREATALPGLTSVAVVGDGNAACGIRLDGQIVCWGSNLGGRLGNGATSTDAGATASNTPVAVAVAGPWSQLVGGSDYFCALKDGGIHCWGSSASAIGRTSNAPSPALVGSGYTAVAASPKGNQTCGIKADGSAYCWGYNVGGSGSFATTPVQVPAAGTTKWSRIAPGVTSTCGVQNDGSAWCWGGNNTGQLGRGSADGTFYTAPNRVGSRTDWVEIVNNGASICALTTSGAASCWGAGTNGQLGTGVNGGTYAPTAVAGGRTWAKLSASGDGAACGLTTSSKLYCWGRNDRGQLGTGGNAVAYSPTASGDATLSYADVTVGSTVYALPVEGTPSASTSGRLYSWGATAGLGTPLVGDGSSPIVVGTVGNWIGTTGGNLFACAWTADGNASCWGQNAVGQLGNGGRTNAGTPTAIAGGRSWVQIAAADATACGIASGNKLFCWGNNDKGQMGVGTLSSASSPTAAAPTEYFERIFAGPSSFCATAYGGQLKCWGSNTTGIVGIGTSGTTPVTKPTAIGANIAVTTAAIGNTAACAIRDTGNLYCWGNATYGQLLGNGSSTSPLPVTNALWTAVAAAGDSFCAIRVDGRLFCWGNNPASGALLGDRSSGSPRATGAVATETEVYGGGTWISIAGVQGQTAFCGTRTNGSTSCWGQAGAIPNATANPSPMGSPSGGGMLGISLGAMNGYGVR